MKKKTTGLLCLAAGLLVGAAIAAPSSIALVKANEGDAPVAAATFAIAKPNIDGVAFTVKDRAAAGEVVEVHIVVDASKVCYTGSLLVNGLKASKDNDTTYHFVMPNEDATLVLEYQEVEPEKTLYNVHHVHPEGMHFEGLGNAYEAGAEVSFKITFDAYAGITWNGYISIYTGAAEDKEELAHLETNDGYFTFTMPEAEVTVEAEAEVRNYNLKRAEGDHSSYKAFADIEFLDGENANRLFEGGDLYSKAARVGFGSTVRVHMRNYANDLPEKEAFYPEGFRIVETGEVFMLEADKDYADFQMLGRDLTLEAIVSTRHFGLTLENGEHTAIEVYHKDDEGNFIKDDEPSALYNETLYIRVPSNDANYGVSKLHLTAINEARDDDGNQVVGIDRDIDFDAKEGYFVFTVNGIYESMTLTVTESNALANPTPVTEAHLEAIIYVAGNDGLVALDENNHAFPGSQIFVKINALDEDYGAKVVSGTYATEEAEGLALAFTKNGEYYVANLPTNATSFAINATEQIVYNKTGLVGDYVAKDYTVSSDYSTNNAYMTKVNPAGTFGSSSSVSYAMQELTPAAQGAAYGTFTAKKGSMNGTYSTGYFAPETQDSYTSEDLYLFAYSEKVIMWQNTTAVEATENASPIASPTTIHFAFKSDANNEAALNFYTVKMTIDEENFVFGQAMYGEEAWANVMVNLTRGTYYIDNNLEIELTAGNNIAAADAFFDVRYAGADLYSIGSDAAGNKVLLDGYQGEYTVDGVALTLDGVHTANYGGNEYDYVLANGQVTLTRNDIVAEGAVLETVILNNFDAARQTADLVSITRAEPVALNIDPTGKTSSSNAYNFEEVELDGVKCYKSMNGGVNSSTAEMTMTAYISGQLSFDYEVDGETNYDYMTIKKNGNIVAGFEKVGNSNATVAGSFAIEVEAGDVISIAYRKDSSTDKNRDCVIIKNVRLVNPGEEAGSYTGADNGTEVILDGFGHGTYGEIAFEYVIDDGRIEDVELNLGIVEDNGSYYKNVRTLSFDLENKTVTDRLETIEATVGNPEITFSDTYPFTYDGTGVYTSGNIGINSCTSYMYITADRDGVLSFDYETGGEGAYDYMNITKDGQQLLTSKGSGTSDNHTSGTFTLAVKAGDVITISYKKDSGTAVGMDCAKISNILLLVA